MQLKFKKNLIVEKKKHKAFGYSSGLFSPFHGLKLLVILRLNPLKIHLISKVASMTWR